jgi:glycosyltransferase involved in cell wall biosynthesis
VIKVLIVNKIDAEGGAARAAYRLHKSLLGAGGIDSQMLVQKKTSDDYTVTGPQTIFEKLFAYLSPHIDRIPVRLYKRRKTMVFFPSWFSVSGIVDKINEINPDIVHFHWIAGGMLRIEDLVKIKKPIVWSLHDMSPFTGGCHYDDHCGRYTSTCGSCPALGSMKKNDLSHRIFSRKKKVYDAVGGQLTFVGLSRWISECAFQSTLIGSKRIVNLPNPIDSERFRPIAKLTAKSLLGIPAEKKIMLFGALKVTDDTRKGYREMVEACKGLKQIDVELIVFGSSTPKDAPDFGLPVHYLGRLHDDLALQIVYSAADVMVVPSLQENLSNVIMESLSCGTPVVAFNIGGNSDMVVHRKNGYLARAYDPGDLAHGIEWVLNNPEYENLSQNARGKVLQDFDSRIVVQKYIELYERLLR